MPHILIYLLVLFQPPAVDVGLSVSLISASGSEYEQSVYLAFITELSVYPVSVNASICDLCWFKHYS